MMTNLKKYLISALLYIGVICTSTYAAETVTYFHNDALGSPVAATDSSGNLLWREDYKPYGERIRKEAASKDNNLWYTGKPHEEDFGLTYFGARWYSPQMGRFTGIDPAGFSEGNTQSFNRYAYAANNPYKYIDPDGRRVEVSDKMKGIVNNLKKNSPTAKSILNKLIKDPRLFYITTGHDESGGTALPYQGARASWFEKHFLGEKDGLDGMNITVNLDPKTHETGFYDKNGNTFTETNERLLGHELGHAQIWADGGFSEWHRNQVGAVDTENKIAKELNPKSPVRHRTKGHGGESWY